MIIDRVKYILPFLFLLVFVNSSMAQNNSIDSLKQQSSVRPKVGLVFSGGGAKGFAYIGLLKVLEEVNMPIDYVGGTSIGAIVGGLYSMGYSSDTIKSLIRAQDWDKVITNQVDRKYISYEEKQFTEKYKLTVPIKDNKISIGNNLSGSLHIDMLFARMFAPAIEYSDFNDLPVPFVCIGTDLVTGEKVVLDSGNLARAIRASMAIPGYFPAVEYNGRLLIDGGVVDNYPVEQVKAMGADIIIGGDVQAKRRDIDDISSLAVMFDHIIAFNRKDINKKGIEDTDHYIHFEMKYEVMSFTSYDSIMALGERVAREHYDELKALADSLNSLDGGAKEKEYNSPLDSIFISKIELKGVDNLHRKMAGGFYKDIENGYVHLDDVEKAIQYIYGLRNFSEVYYETNKEGDESVLTLNLKPAGQGSVSAGIHFDNDYGGSLLTNLTLRNLFNTRMKFFSDLALGNAPRWKSQLILNNGLKPGFGIESDMYRFKFDLYDSVGNASSAITIEKFAGAGFVPLMFRESFMFKLGAEYTYLKYTQNFNIDSSLTLEGRFNSYSSLYMTVNYDSRDKLSFPTDGWNLEFKAAHSLLLDDISEFNKAGVYSAYAKCDANFEMFNKFTFRPGIFAGYAYSNADVFIQEKYGFGGINSVNYIEKYVPFAGLRFIERQGDYAGITRAHFQYETYKNLYLTGMLDYGITEDDIEGLIMDNTIYGYGLKLSYSSVIGPVEGIVMGSSEHSGPVFYVNVGFWF